MSIYPESSLGEILEPSSAFESVDPDAVYVTAGIYSYGRGLFKRPTINGYETNYPKYNKLKAGQFVYSKLFGWEGALATVPAEFDGLYVSHEFPTFEIRDERVDLRYMAHLATWEGLHVKLRDQGAGMGSRRQRVNVDRLLAVTIPLPDLLEQRRVAARLDSVLSGIKQVDGLRGRRARLLTAHQESLVSTTSAGATNSDELDKLLRAVRSPIDIDESAKYRALGMRSFGKGTIRYPEAAGSELSKLRYFSFPVNALVLSNIKAWEGAIGVTSVEDLACVASNRFLFYLAADDRINTRYLRYYLLSKRGLAQISACSPGSADRNRTLSIKSFERIRVPLPSRPEQDRVAKLLDSLSEHLDPVRTDAVVKSLRPSLLNAAFSGEL